MGVTSGETSEAKWELRLQIQLQLNLLALALNFYQGMTQGYAVNSLTMDNMPQDLYMNPSFFSSLKSSSTRGLNSQAKEPPASGINTHDPRWGQRDDNVEDNNVMWQSMGGGTIPC